MEHVKALAIKLVVHLLLGWVVFDLFFGAPLEDSLIVAAVVAILIYIVGDMVILRKIGNVVATVVDAGTAFLVAWLYFANIVDGDFLLASLVFALGVGIFEWFFHSWLLDNVIPDERSVK